MKSKILISNVSPNNRKSTKVFTERGLYMLATVLKGERARDITFAIIETFAKVRELKRELSWLLKDKHSLGLCPTPRGVNSARLCRFPPKGRKNGIDYIKVLSARQPINSPSRVPRYQKGQEIVGFCDFLVKSLANDW